MFFKKRPPLYVTKLFVMVDPDDRFDFEWIKTRLFGFCKATSTAYSINYRKDQPIGKFGATSRPYFFKNVDSLFLHAADGPVITMGIGGVSFGNENAKRIFHIDVEHDPERGFSDSAALIRAVADKFSLRYAYARSMPGNFSAGSETRVHRSLFGTTVKVERMDKTWMLPPQDILQGAIKGIYPVNHSQVGVAAKLKDAGFWLPGRIAGDGVVVFDGAEMAEIARRNAALRQFIHVDHMQ